MDARALLREAAAEREHAVLARIHDAAAVFVAGALRCALCDVPIKHERLWSAHANSAAHRERRAGQVEQPGTPAPDGKRKLDADAPDAKRQRSMDAEWEEFQRVLAKPEPEPEPEPEAQVEPAAGRSAAPAPDAERQRGMDAEWEEFQRALAEPAAPAAPAASAAPVAPAAPTAPALPASDSRYEHATVSAEPEMRQPERAPEAAPAASEETHDAARLAAADQRDFLARLDEEARVQEEGADRVQALKRRLARIRARRT